MKAPTRLSDVRETIATEHEELDASFQRMRTFLSQRPRHLTKMAADFRALVELLREHFAHEEQGGYFLEVLEIAPHLFHDVEHLRREHQILLETAERMARDIQFAEDSYVWRNAIQYDLEAFIRTCHEHDAAETRLVQEAWCHDIGPAD